MKSWVDIKKGNQISRVPYTAFKDVFERDGFVIIDDNLAHSPTFSLPTQSTTIKKEELKTNEQNGGNKRKVNKKLVK